MNILLIVLSLSVNQDFSFCKDKLRQIGEVAELTENSLLIKTPQRSTDVRDFIKTNGLAQRIFVTKVNHGAAWYNLLTQNPLIKEWYGSIE